MNSRARHAAIVAVIVALTASLYAGSLHAPFVFDDFPNIVKNPYIQRFDGSFESLLEVARKSPSKRPVANVSFALNHQIGGNGVVGYHVVNVAIHIINGLLVYALALTLFDPSGRGVTQPGSRSGLDRRTAQMAAAFAAAVFVSHPLQVQSVTYIVQRMNSLATLFYLAALLLFISGRHVQWGAKRALRWAASAMCWLLALGSKQTAITLPAVLLLYEWYFVQGLSPSWLARNARYFVAAAVVGIVLIAMNVEVLNLASYAERDFTMGERLLTQLRVVVFYASLVVAPLPSRLTLSHAFSTSQSLLDPPTTLLCLVAIIAALVGGGLIARRAPIASFGVLWFFLHLLLESTFLPLEMVFEHRLYVPLIGVDLVASYLLFRTLGARTVPGLPPSVPVAAPIAVAIVLALSAGTLTRNQTWSAPATLWADVVAKNRSDHRAQSNLGIALSDQGRFWESIQHHTESLRLEPDNAKAHNGMGVALAGQEKYAEAVKHFAASLRINPTDPETKGNIALALSRMQLGTRSAPGDRTPELK